MKRLALAGAALALVLAATPALAQYMVFPDSSQRIISNGELADLGCQDLWIARNEIYHRNGYCFKTKRGKAFFSNAGCWTQNPSLSNVEQRNVARIQDWEGRYGCR
ncbi:MAG TPA: YARHG domain-containing protein [Hyphomicrobiales bacterium]|nr:YARHG domain-containing protein [Kaistiaceae bacterium]HQF30349.1 YARHG domain-containing protein [Hyphomicrobiales bacterium]